MRHLLFSLLCLAAAGAYADSSIALEEKSHDFGLIQEDKGPVSHQFTFTNNGDSPLVILDAKAECGCTRPTIPLQPIAPGKSASIKVTYLPAGRPGEFIKSVKVTTNDPKNKKIKLKISGSVIPSSEK